MLSLFRPKPMLTDAVQDKIVESIKAAESTTSGEIRVYMERKCAYVDAMDRAKEIFASLAMEKTTERNAVIIYLALDDRQFALYGDEAIYTKAGGPAFWQAAAAKLAVHLKANDPAAGISGCIFELGKALAHYFPHNPAIKKNELPDEIVFGK